MTVQTNAMEIVETMIKGIEDIPYFTEAGRMEDLSFECLDVIRTLEEQIEEEVLSDNTNVKNLLALTSQLADYTVACDYFKDAVIEEDNKTEEEENMTNEYTIEEVDAFFLEGAPLRQIPVEGFELPEVAQDVVEVVEVQEAPKKEEEVKMTNTQEEVLVELKDTLELRHAELNAKFQDTIAKAKVEAASGSIELAETYKAIAEVLEQQLSEVEVELTSTKKKLTRVRAAKVVAVPVVAAVAVTKVAVKVAKVVIKTACVVGRVVFRGGKKVVSFVRGLFRKNKVKTVVSSDKTASPVVVSKAKGLASNSKSVAKSIVSHVVSGSRKVCFVVRKGWNASANFVLGTSIVVLAIGRKAGRLLNQASIVVHNGIGSAVDTARGFRRGAVA